MSYTGSGGILHINHIGNDTYGTYECCETYFPSNYVTVDIIPRYVDGGNEIITRCEGKQNTGMLMQ
ncbi:hypothetical protein DPMN_023888 [Dreissena polymorpha]|uniref:Uncharacterized protein n=1 Tax=Dreissena polymorpha TaxID=45954 RepID=A0A9D4LNI9_DREPO|nr:hypothetical protein DPMN_023888 [Dreissena polymorpha]